MYLNIKYFDKNCPKIEKKEKGDWIDLRIVGAKINGINKKWVNNIILYEKGDFIMVQTGIALQLPLGHEAHVSPRSSTFKKFGLIQTNSVGVIDETYCGDNDQWFVPMLAMKDGKFELYNRVAQFRIIEKMSDINFTEIDKLISPDRGGNGSTGYN